MVFSDTSTKNGLIQDCEMLVFNEYGKITGNTNLLYNFTNLLNRQYDKAVSIIIERDGRWQYDDSSYTTRAVATTGIVSGQDNYTMDASHLKLVLVRIKDESGNWSVLRPFDITDPEAYYYLREQSTAVTGDPHWYEKQGDQMILYPTPDYTQAASLEVTVQRVPNYFSYDDTTQEAGLAPIFHRILSLGASLDYAVANSLAQKNDLAMLYQDERDRMIAFYSMRNRDEQKTLRAKQHRVR